MYAKVRNFLFGGLVAGSLLASAVPAMAARDYWHWNNTSGNGEPICALTNKTWRAPGVSSLGIGRTVPAVGQSLRMKRELMILSATSAKIIG